MSTTRGRPTPPPPQTLFSVFLFVLYIKSDLSEDAASEVERYTMLAISPLCDWTDRSPKRVAQPHNLLSEPTGAKKLCHLFVIGIGRLPKRVAQPHNLLVSQHGQRS
jgi:hypothetical protein